MSVTALNRPLSLKKTLYYLTLKSDKVFGLVTQVVDKLGREQLGLCKKNPASGPPCGLSSGRGWEVAAKIISRNIFNLSHILTNFNTLKLRTHVTDVKNVGDHHPSRHHEHDDEEHHFHWQCFVSTLQVSVGLATMLLGKR